MFILSMFDVVHKWAANATFLGGANEKKDWRQGFIIWHMKKCGSLALLILPGLKILKHFIQLTQIH